MCRPGDHPEYTYMAYILYIFIAVDLYLALGMSMCRPADLPTCQPILNIHTLAYHILYISRMIHLYILYDKPCL